MDNIESMLYAEKPVDGARLENEREKSWLKES